MNREAVARIIDPDAFTVDAPIDFIANQPSETHIRDTDAKWFAMNQTRRGLALKKADAAISAMGAEGKPLSAVKER